VVKNKMHKAVTATKIIGLLLIALGFFVLSRLNLLGVAPACPACTPPPTCGPWDVFCQIGSIPAGVGYTTCTAGNSACYAQSAIQNTASALLNVFLLILCFIVLLKLLLVVLHGG